MERSPQTRMELIVSFFVTWSIILLPPIVMRVIRGTFFSKPWAIAIALLLLFANHIIFAGITERQSPRPFLTLGAFATFLILRWQTRASAADSVAAQRRALGYPSDPPRPLAEPPTLRPHVTERPLAASVSRARLSRRGWIRIWIVATTCWLLVVAGRVWYELDGQASFLVFADRVDYRPDLEDRDLDRVERNLRKALDRNQMRQSPPVETAGQSSNEYGQILDEEIRTRDALVAELLRNADAAPLSGQRAMALAQDLGLPLDAVLRAPSDAQRLHALIELRSAMASNPILRYQVLGHKSPTYHPRVMVIASFVLLPPISLILIWATVMWIVRGFRSEA